MGKKKKSKYSAESHIKEKSESFINFYNKYFMGEETTESTTDYTTQLYYQSMEIEKKRLEQNDLHMNTSVEMLPYYNDVQTLERGKQSALCNCRKTKTSREFFRYGKRIYREKNNEEVRVNFLESEVDGKVECPNCGYKGEVSSFIDGCDQCGSKFEVKEFEPKVSAFTMNQDVEKDTEKITKETANIASGLAIVLALFIVVGIVASIYLQVNNADSLAAGMVAGMGLYLFTPTLRFIVIVFITLNILGIVFKTKYAHSITNAEIIQEKIQDFSVQDFFQNVEMRFNQIYLANAVNDVQAYAECSLDNIVESHLDVVDSHMSQLHFMGIEDAGNHYLIKAWAKMRLYRFADEKIKRVCEKVTFEVKVSKVGRSMTFIKAYKCNKCGSTIDIMKGGVCDHCGNALSLDDVGMKLASIEFEKTANSLAPKFMGQCAIAFAACFAINAILPCLSVQMYNPIQVVKYVVEMPEAVAGFYGDIPAIEDIVDASEIEKKRSSELDNRVEITYTLKDAKAAFEKYKEKLSGSAYDIKVTGENSFRAKKYVVYFVETGYVVVTFTLDDNKLKVVYDILDVEEGKAQ